MNVETLNAERKKRGLSIKELADLATLPQSTVEKILFGVVKNPRMDTLEAIERALGLDKGAEWTDEEKALGVGDHPVKISDDEYKWLELRSELLRVMGEDYVKATESLLQAIIEKKDEKS